MRLSCGTSTVLCELVVLGSMHYLTQGELVRSQCSRLSTDHILTHALAGPLSKLVSQRHHRIESTTYSSTSRTVPHIRRWRFGHISLHAT
ncbi:hypothetical protein EDB84DRAFT_1503509 [Lactarius hengduanensis]|nr:hypothetical protein EDB84DRAFT_1503509 [Lactarius hengduanensis]